LLALVGPHEPGKRSHLCVHRQVRAEHPFHRGVYVSSLPRREARQELLFDIRGHAFLEGQQSPDPSERRILTFFEAGGVEAGEVVYLFPAEPRVPTERGVRGQSPRALVGRRGDDHYLLAELRGERAQYVNARDRA